MILVARWRAHPEHTARRHRVTREAVLAARVIPRLRAVDIEVKARRRQRRRAVRSHRHAKINRAGKCERLRRVARPVRAVATVKRGEHIAHTPQPQPRIRVAHRGLRARRIERSARAARRVARLEFVAARVVVARLGRRENERHHVARIRRERLAHHESRLRVKVRVVERLEARADIEIASALRRDEAERIARPVNIRAARRHREAAIQRRRRARRRRADVRARERAEAEAAGDRHVLRQRAREQVGV